MYVAPMISQEYPVLKLNREGMPHLLIEHREPYTLLSHLQNTSPN